jgi:hypothetical protein
MWSASSLPVPTGVMCFSQEGSKIAFAFATWSSLLPPVALTIEGYISRFAVTLRKGTSRYESFGFYNRIYFTARASSVQPSLD